MIYSFDLDGTLFSTEGMDYEGSTPMPQRIDVVNRLYNKGHRIIIDTARGSVTGDKDKLYKLTERQLKDAGLLYHELRVGMKPYADRYVDDKGINDGHFF